MIETDREPRLVRTPFYALGTPDKLPPRRDSNAGFGAIRGT